MTIFKRIALLVPALAFSTVAMAAEGTNAGGAEGTLIWWISPISALLALGFAFYFYKKAFAAVQLCIP